MIKNPHLYWLDLSSTIPILKREIYLDGTLTLRENKPLNLFEIDSKGKIHAIHFNTGGEELSHFQCDGNVSSELTGNLRKIVALFSDNSKGSEKKSLFLVLDILKQLTIDVKQLKITSIAEKKEYNLLEISQGKIAYQTLEKATTLSISADLKRQSFGFLGETLHFTFPSFGVVEDQYVLNLQLPSIENLKKSHRIEEFSLTGNSKHKSALTSSKLSLSVSGKYDERKHYLTQFNLEGIDQYDSGWIQALQSPVVSEIKKEKQNKKDQMTFSPDRALYNWLTSSTTTPFLLLLSSENKFKWSGNIDYLDSLQKFASKLYWLGSQKTGIDADIHYPKEASTLTLVGGRVVIEQMISLYNAFKESLKLEIFPIFSTKAKDKLIQILLEFADKTDASDDNMAFTIKFDGAKEATIGNYSMDQFTSKLMNFFNKFFSEKRGNEKPVFP